MPLPLSSYSILACFAQRTRIPTSARSIGFCVIWVCISSSSIYLIIYLFGSKLLLIFTNPTYYTVATNTVGTTGVTDCTTWVNNEADNFSIPIPLEDFDKGV